MGVRLYEVDLGLGGGLGAELERVFVKLHE